MTWQAAIEITELTVPPLYFTFEGKISDCESHNRINSNDMELPNDPMMLFSTVNMYLRDRYQSLDELCADLDIDRKELEAKLLQASFEYSEKYNKFW